jgi:hypothetical protein
MNPNHCFKFTSPKHPVETDPHVILINFPLQSMCVCSIKIEIIPYQKNLIRRHREEGNYRSCISLGTAIWV